MIKFPVFRRTFMTFRVGQFAELRNVTELTELPYGSILHELDRFQMHGDDTSLSPSIDNPIVNMNNFKLLMTNVVDPTAVPKEYAPVVINHMLLTNAGVVGKLADYKREMAPRVIYFDSIRDLATRVGAQKVVNYNPLFRARVMGVRRKPRLMNMVLASVVNTIMQAPDQMHFVHIPLESLVFEKKDFLRVFKKYDRIATRYPEISSYLFLAHLYSILMKPINMPPRGLLLEEDEKDLDATESFSIPLAELDLDCTASEWFTNIRNYVMDDDQLALETLDMKDTDNPYQVSVFEYLPPTMFERINFILTCNGKFIIYNLRDLKDINGRAGAGIIRIIKHINMLCAGGSPEDVEQAELPMVAESIVSVDETRTKANQPSFVQPMTKEEKQEALDEDLRELDNFEKILSQDVTVAEKPLTLAQKEHVKKISKTYKHLTIGDKTFQEVLTTVPDFDVEMPDGNITAVKEGALNENATTSSTAKLDAAYVQKSMTKDIAAIVTSFNKLNMYLVDFKEKVKEDELNSEITYSATFEDLGHKKHTFTFTIPKVDQFGNYMDNGSLKTINKQRVSCPICKVSPTRVTLNSNYNKILIERNTSVAHTFINWFVTSLKKAQADGFRTMLVHGSCKYPMKALPFEITELGGRYTRINFNNGFLFFDVVNRESVMEAGQRDMILKMEHENGLWFGCKNDKHFFATVTGNVTVKSVAGEEVFYGAFVDFFEWLFSMQLSPMTEYITATILSREVPLIHPLAYRYGLTNMLKYTGCDYEVHDINERIERKTSDILVRFSDKKLLIRRTPRNNALLFGGLCIYDFSNVALEDMDDKDIYFELLSQKGISTNFIKGLDPLFDMFIDPITRDVLREMKEPTDIRDLMLRAATMLTTSEHKPAASASNFRFRGVEQITGVVYNEMARAFANYKNRSGNGAIKFSVSAYQVKQRIAHMQLTENVSLINPINDIKQYSKFSNTGDGGRSNETFMIADRQFTEDQIGVVSEATVDNGKTGMNAMLPFNPVIVNERGMVQEGVDIDKLEPENVLSLTSLLMPGVTQDDGKRANFVNIQLSHYVPIAQSDVSRVRTGFEEVVAQRCHNQCFAVSAKKDGVIADIDENSRTITIQYSDGGKELISYGPEYTNNSANGFYVTQDVVINNFRRGDRVKAGDIVAYNKQFFQADPYSKQVRWKIGILAKVALLDNGGTIEDASILTQPLCDKMSFNPVHVKEIVITKDTNVHAFANIGNHVNNTDPLIVFDQSTVTFGDGDGDPELMRMLSDLNKSAPKAGHTGEIVQVDVLYKCQISEMSPTLQKIVRHVSKFKNARAAKAEGCENQSSYHKSAPLTGTDKVGITNLDADTVILKFYIKQNKGMSPGDKLFFDSSLKSVCSTVYPDYILAEDGTKVEAATSCRGVMHRLITSPFVTGIGNAVLEKLEENMLRVYSGQEPIDQNK